MFCPHNCSQKLLPCVCVPSGNILQDSWSHKRQLKPPQSNKSLTSALRFMCRGKQHNEMLFYNVIRQWWQVEELPDRKWNTTCTHNFRSLKQHKNTLKEFQGTKYYGMTAVPQKQLKTGKIQQRNSKVSLHSKHFKIFKKNEWCSPQCSRLSLIGKKTHTKI